jgi:hypothetical protein
LPGCSDHQYFLSSEIFIQLPHSTDRNTDQYGQQIYDPETLYHHCVSLQPESSK